MDQRICDQCDNEQSIFYCRECELRYCKSFNCSELFHSKGKLKEHDVQDLDSCMCQLCSHTISIVVCEICDMNFCEPCWNKWHSKGTLQNHEKQLLGKSCDTVYNEEPVSISSSTDPSNIPERLRKTSLGYIANPKGKRAQYYMSIMTEAHLKMRLVGESDESFKKKFATERARRYDFLKIAEATFQSADKCSERSGTYRNPKYTLKPSDGRNLDYVIREHQNALKLLNDLQAQLTSHNSTLFHHNGRTLKQGTEFLHEFNTDQMTKLKENCLKMSKELEVLEERVDEYRRVFKGMKGKYISQGRRKKENRRKANSRKRKRLENNVSRVYNKCVKYPLANELPKFLLYPPSVSVPEECIDVEHIAGSLACRDAPYVAHLLQKNTFTNAGASRLLTNLELKVRNRVYCFLYPDEYSMNQEQRLDSLSDSLNEAEEEDETEDALRRMMIEKDVEEGEEGEEDDEDGVEGEEESEEGFL